MSEWEAWQWALWLFLHVNIGVNAPAALYWFGPGKSAGLGVIHTTVVCMTFVIAANIHNQNIL